MRTRASVSAPASIASSNRAVEFARDGVALEANRVRVDALRPRRVELREAQRAFFGRTAFEIAGGVGHGVLTGSVRRRCVARRA